jgi:hypothetical protein
MHRTRETELRAPGQFRRAFSFSLTTNDEFVEILELAIPVDLA